VASGLQIRIEMPRLEAKRVTRWVVKHAAPALGLAGLLASLSTGAVGSGGCSASSPDAAATNPLPAPPTCGDGVCSHDDGEICENCAADCGQCPVCGNGQCEASTGLESCESCAEDCGACSICGDGTCSAASGETCLDCAEDCGVCEGCGDGTCAVAETCQSCSADCGACESCGNGTCEAGSGESCSTCEDDCGACDTCGDGECNGDEDCDSCAKDCGTCARKGCVQGDFQVYYGGLHAHTHVSDGQGTPAEAFHHASQVTKPAFDFLWLSDHHNGITPAEWKACQAAADKYDVSGSFVAGCGYEKTVFDANDHGIGHFNTLFPDKLYKLPHGIPGLYQAIAECGPCLGQFNHPPWPGTFLNYKFFPAGLDKVRLIEFNGHGAWDAKMKSYFTALANGWRVSPSWNEDNHHGGWGDSSRATLIWAPKLTRGSVRAAVRANRTLATNDDTSRMKMMADDACWMGSVLHGFGSTKITVELSDKQKNDGFALVRLYGPNQKLLATKDCKGQNPCKVSFPLDVQKRTHVVVVARQKDDDVIVSGPIWYEP